MERLKQMLHNGGYSCVIGKGEEVRTFMRRGVADLFWLLKNEPSFLYNAFLADKVVGKGAAALAVLGGVQRVYADTMSQAAFDLLCENGVPTETAEVVPFIRNRKGDGMCPVETLCLNAPTAADCLPKIETFMAQHADS